MSDTKKYALIKVFGKTFLSNLKINIKLYDDGLTIIYFYKLLLLAKD